MGQELVPVQTETLPVNITTGEIERQDLSVQFYQNASTLKITKEEQLQLQEPVDPEDIEIRPDGLIYYPQVFARQKLNDTFGAGQWALIEHSTPKINNTLCFVGSLYIRGCFVAKAIGEHEYWENNKNQSWASVYEAAKSDCLVRCCKDLGIGKELWQPKYGRAWVKEHAVKVFVKVKDRQSGKEETKVQWRRKDQDPYWNETGIVPNQNAEPPKQEKPEQKPAPKQEPKQRNWTKEIGEIKCIKDLTVLWGGLTDKEQEQAKGVFGERKSELQKAEEEAKEKLIKDIEAKITEINIATSELELDAIDSLMDKLPKQQRDKLTSVYNEKCKSFDFNHEYSNPL